MTGLGIDALVVVPLIIGSIGEIAGLRQSFIFGLGATIGLVLVRSLLMMLFSLGMTMPQIAATVVALTIIAIGMVIAIVRSAVTVVALTIITIGMVIAIVRSDDESETKTAAEEPARKEG